MNGVNIAKSEPIASVEKLTKNIFSNSSDVNLVLSYEILLFKLICNEKTVPSWN